MSTQGHGSPYPVDDAGFVRQCAWCGRVADEHGRYRLVEPTMIQGASHGCCETCAIRFLNDGVDEPPRAARAVRASF
jgi:hypothetical protein